MRQDLMSEDRVLTAVRMPTFDDYCSEEEAEKLMCGLSAPLLRIPLTLSFFAAERTALLFHPMLRQIL